jgi:uncharacterized membrane protein YbhN (UPF0104 family)
MTSRRIAPENSAVAEPEAATSGGTLSTSRRRAWKLVRRLLPTLLSLILIVAVFWYFLPKFASVSAIWISVRSMSGTAVAVLVAAASWNLVTYCFVMVSTMPGLTFAQAAVATQTTTAVSNTLPAGSAAGVALSYGMFSSWGFSRSRTSVSLLVSGVWNNFAKLGMPVLALALLALQGTPSAGRLAAALVGLGALVLAVAVLGLALYSESTAHRLGVASGRAISPLLKVLRRKPVHGWELATVKFRKRTVLLLRKRWLSISVATLVSHASLFVVLLLALRATGVTNSQVSWAEVLAVFAFARLLTAIPLTPGGLGVVEVALIAGLSAAGGARAGVAAAVLVFRALTYVLPIPLGLVTYVIWRRTRSWRRPPGGAPRTELVPDQA